MQTSGRNPLEAGGRTGAVSRAKTRIMQKTVALATLLISLVWLLGCNGNPDPSYVSPTSNNPAPGVTLQAIQITPSTSLISIAESRQLTATGVYSDGGTTDLTSQVAWRASSAPSTTNFVSINPGGMATGRAIGATVITATFGGVVGVIQLTVETNGFTSGTIGILDVPYKSSVVDAAYVPQQTLIQGAYAVQEVNLDADQFSSVLPVPLALLASIPMPAGFVPNATAASQSSSLVAVTSYTSPNVQIIDASNLSTDLNNNTVIATYTAPLSQKVTFNGVQCMICAIVVNPLNDQLLLSTAQGYYEMNLTTGAFTALSFTPPALPAPSFSLDPTATNPYILSPNPTTGEVQILNLTTKVATVGVSGLTAPAAAAIDLTTSNAAIVDAGTNALSLVDLTNAQSPVFMPVAGIGVCGQPALQNMVAMGVSANAVVQNIAHTLFTSQTSGNCVGFESPWPISGNPLDPSLIYYGYGPMPNTPDNKPFVNGKDPNVIAAFNSVYDKNNYGLLMDANQQWIAKIKLSAVISAAGISPGNSTLTLPSGTPILPELLTAVPDQLSAPDIVFLPSPSTAVTLSVTNISFGSLGVGTASPASPVNLADIGLQIISPQISVQGANAGDFLATSNCSNLLQPRTSCAINVTFTPTAKGSRSATLTVSYGGTSPLTVPLSGTGT